MQAFRKLVNQEDGQGLVEYTLILVLMVHAYVSRALARGVRQMDFLRGDEPYKYEWGAHDEPIQRVLVRRRDG